MGDVPWEAITSDPAKYYNVEAAYFSIKLDHPQNLSTIQVLTLVEGLLSTSVITSPNPFHFEQEKVLALETPAPAPSQSPSPEAPKSPSPPPTSVQSTPVVEPKAKRAKRKRYCSRVLLVHPVLTGCCSSQENPSEISDKTIKKLKVQSVITTYFSYTLLSLY